MSRRLSVAELAVHLALGRNPEHAAAAEGGNSLDAGVAGILGHGDLTALRPHVPPIAGPRLPRKFRPRPRPLIPPRPRHTTDGEDDDDDYDNDGEEGQAEALADMLADEELKRNSRTDSGPRGDSGTEWPPQSFPDWGTAFGFVREPSTPSDQSLGSSYSPASDHWSWPCKPGCAGCYDLTRVLAAPTSAEASAYASRLASVMSSPLPSPAAGPSRSPSPPPSLSPSRVFSPPTPPAVLAATCSPSRSVSASISVWDSDSSSYGPSLGLSRPPSPSAQASTTADSVPTPMPMPSRLSLIEALTHLEHEAHRSGSGRLYRHLAIVAWRAGIPPGIPPDGHSWSGTPRSAFRELGVSLDGAMRAVSDLGLGLDHSESVERSRGKGGGGYFDRESVEARIPRIHPAPVPAKTVWGSGRNASGSGTTSTGTTAATSAETTATGQEVHDPVFANPRRVGRRRPFWRRLLG